MGDAERRPMPSVLLVILAMLGLASFQKFTGPAPGPDPARIAKEEKAPPADSLSWRRGGGISDQPEARILGPLIDYFRTGADGEYPLGSGSKAQKVVQKHSLRFVIATVPDPVRSTNSHRFDEWIDSIQRAYESEGFLLGGFRMPWGSRATSAKDPDRPGPEPKAGAKPETKPATWTIPSHREPGLLLFHSRKSPEGNTPLLAVLLVPESPTLGLDKVTLGTCLDLAASWDVDNRGGGDARTFRILGPIYSGSQDSLEQTLRNWTSVPGPVKDRANTFEIISGSASSIDVERLTKCVVPPHQINFSATVHRNDALVKVLLKYIGSSSGHIAMLVEANTGFGQANSEKSGLTYYPFPAHISKIRGLYDKQGLLRDQQAGTLRTFEHLSIPFEEAGDATDIPPMQTPGFSTAVDELVLGQILADISHRHIRAVGIIATDPLDVVFLAKEVRQFLPDVRLFATQSYLLFTHPQNVDDLRGMIVASSYPLYPSNQSWSYSYQGDRTHVFFSSESGQGTYNAAIAHLDKIGDKDIPPRFLEYGLPFDPPGSYVSSGDGPPLWSTPKRQPPIWIGMVGNKGIYPLRAVTKFSDQDRSYLYGHDQSEQEYSGPLELPGPQDTSPKQAESWARIRGWFRPHFQRAWLYLFAGLSAACAAGAGIGGLVSWWVLTRKDVRRPERFGLGPLSTARLAQFLNCCRVEGAEREAACRGPGLYLAAALILLMLVYLTISLPHLDVMWRVPWIPLNPLRDTDYWVIAVAYAVIWMMLASLILSLIAWRVTARRSRRPADAGPAEGQVTEPAAGSTPAPQAGPARRRRRRLVLFLNILVLVISALPLFRITQYLRQDALAYSFAKLDDSRRDALLRLARSGAIPSGVSPVLSLLFIGVAGVAWVHAQLKRRYLVDQFTPSAVAPVAGAGVGGAVLSGDALMLRSIQQERGRIDAVLTTPARLLLTTYIIASILVAAVVSMFFFPVVARSLAPLTSEDVEKWSNAVAGLLIAALFGLLSFHTLRLAVLWRHVRKLMNLVLHLPLVPALDRIPTRVAAWFKGAPRPGDARFDLIRRQAQALAHRGEGHGGAVKAELEAILGRRIAIHAWRRFNRSLEELRPESVGDVIVPIRDYLVECWKPATVQAVFPDASTGSPQEVSADGGVSSELHNIAMAVSQGAVPPAEAPKRLPEWVQLAEDLLAMLFMRWLAVSLAQVWTLIGFLVVGSLALLLAISSYPFPFQSGMLFGVGLLIGALVLMILGIVVGFNRDELVSRLSNTAPNRLKLDHNLMGGLFTYIIPLAGALAAISLDSADTIRSLLDPILRHLR